MIGPSLPPHLQKKTDTSAEDDSKETTTSVSPAVKPAVTGPQLPPHLLAAREAKRKRKREEESNTDSKESSYAPAPPPKRPTEGPRLQSPAPANPSESESDDEVGPSLAVMMTPAESAEYTRKQAIERLSRTSPDPNTKSTSEPKLQRDSWMLAPPTRADWLGTLDASKLKSRTFNQSKSGTNLQSKTIDHTIWTESPLERAQRLEDEALGRRPTKPAAPVEDVKKSQEDIERDRRIKEFNAQTRGPSLMEKYSGMRKVEDDDPSKRAFDYQKDIAGGRPLGFKERNAMINKAKDLDSKYSGGSYL
jgi:Protein of unknown function (DUF3752)